MEERGKKEKSREDGIREGRGKRERRRGEVVRKMIDMSGELEVHV